MKRYGRVYFSLFLLLAISGRSQTQRKLNPHEKFPIYVNRKSVLPLFMLLALVSSATYRDHFVWRLSVHDRTVCVFIFPAVTLFGSQILVVVTLYYQSYHRPSMCRLILSFSRSVDQGHF